MFTDKQTVLSEALKDTAVTPYWKRRCAELYEHIPVVFRAFHWQPALRTKNMASMAARLPGKGARVCRLSVLR